MEILAFYLAIKMYVQCTLPTNLPSFVFHWEIFWLQLILYVVDEYVVADLWVALDKYVVAIDEYVVEIDKYLNVID